ncbi:ankyrin, partial [Choiromyces venosus 120613-1]
GRAEMVELLLDSRADIGATNPADGITPLICAVRFARDVRLVKALLAKGAKPDPPDANGMTALHHGVSDSARLDSFLAMLEVNPDVNVRCPSGRTPLHLAIQNSHTALATALIDHGADVTVRC